LEAEEKMTRSYEERAAHDTSSLELARRGFLKRLGFLAVGMPMVSLLSPLFGCRRGTGKTDTPQRMPVPRETSACTSAPLTAETVQAIIEMGEDKAELRNLKITQCYYNLSWAIVALVGQEHANWCTFATWASKTAGTFIRQDTFGEKLITFFKEPLPEQANIIKTVSREIAAGNLKVFQELGPIFVRLVDTFNRDTSFDNVKLELFLAPLRHGAVEANGQDLLRSAIRLYYGAKFATEARTKAEKMLLANAQIAYHEQMRLQDNIHGALNALPEKLEKSEEKPEDGGMSQQWREFATSNFMQLYLPSGPIELGGDLRLPPGQPLFPSELQEIGNAELRQFLEQHGALEETAQVSGPIDWANFDQRISFLLKLFRSRQRDSQLFGPPFTEEQCIAITRDQVPANRYQL
jgi:hypothetical protein